MTIKQEIEKVESEITLHVNQIKAQQDELSRGSLNPTERKRVESEISLTEGILDRLEDDLERLKKKAEILKDPNRLEWELVSKVPSESQEGVEYEVKKNGISGNYGCNCPAFIYGKGVDANGHCKHIKKVVTDQVELEGARIYFKNLPKVEPVKTPIFYHPDECDCVECSARTQKGGLDYDPSNDDDEFEKHEQEVARDVGFDEVKDSAFKDILHVVEGLGELRDEIEERVEKMRELLKQAEPIVGPMALERARLYWLGHIEGALRSKEGGGSFITMDDTLKELKEEI